MVSIIILYLQISYSLVDFESCFLNCAYCISIENIMATMHFCAVEIFMLNHLKETAMFFMIASRRQEEQKCM